MFEIGQYVVYRKDVCIVKDLKEKEDGTYYVLVPVDDSSLKIETKIDNENLRKVISKQDLESIVKEIPNVEILDCSDKAIELEYKNLLSTGNKLDLIKIIKTAYLRNKKRLESKKRLNENDVNYLEKAEKILYNEFSVVLNLTFEEIKKFIIDKVEALT